MDEKIYYEEDVGKSGWIFYALVSIYAAALGFYTFLYLSTPYDWYMDFLIPEGLVLLGLGAFMLILNYKISFDVKNQIGEDHVWLYWYEFRLDNIDHIELVDEDSKDPKMAYIVLKEGKLSTFYRTKKAIRNGENSDLKDPERFVEVLNERGIPVVDER